MTDQQARYAEHLEEILDRLSNGIALRAICRDLDLNECSVRRWMAKDEDTARRKAEAKEMGCDALAEECVEIADTPLIGETVTRKPIVVDGKAIEGAFVEEVRTEDMLGHRRLQIDTRMRLIGKWSSRYADKLAHTGADGGAIKHDVAATIDASNLTDDQLRALASIRVSAE